MKLILTEKVVIEDAQICVRLPLKVSLGDYNEFFYDLFYIPINLQLQSLFWNVLKHFEARKVARYAKIRCVKKQQQKSLMFYFDLFKLKNLSEINHYESFKNILHNLIVLYQIHIEVELS